MFFVGKNRVWLVFLAVVLLVILYLSRIHSRKQENGVFIDENIEEVDEIEALRPEDVRNNTNFALREGKRVSEWIAEEKISKVKSLIGDQRGPFIVGGIGDSGTRGFWDVLMKFGVYMQGEENVRGDSRDSLVFMSRRPTTQSDGSILPRSPSALYNEPMVRSRSIKYNSSHVRPERWQCGRQFIADTVHQIINDTVAKRTRKGKINILHPFGFKHPRTALLLPYFFATLGDKFAFIHVIRDGREVASGDNNYLFMDHCHLYYGGKCSENKAAEMWADLNQEIFEYAMESPMLANQYFAMRIEDLVGGNVKCYENLMKFLEIPNNMEFNLTERMEMAMKNSMQHAKSYFGQKYTYNERVDMIGSATKKVREALKFWGYSETRFELKLDCTSLPWIDAFRKKKGKLLID